MRAKKLPIFPQPGYLLVKPYIFTGPFNSVKESEGEDKFSEVLAVGNEILDSGGFLRKAGCKVGDVIIHTDTNKTFTLDHQQYRFVHFNEVHGIYAA